MKREYLLILLLLPIALFSQIPPSSEAEEVEVEATPYYGDNVEVPPTTTRMRNNYIVYRNSSGKWGIKSPSDDVLLQPEYDRIVNRGNAHIVIKGNKYGLASLKAAILLPVKYDSIVINYVKSNVVKVKKGNKWGVFDTDGNKVLPIKHHEILYCSVDSGIALLRKSASDPITLYLNGKKYRKSIAHISIYNNACIVASNGKQGVVASSKEIIPLEYDTIYIERKKSSRNKNPVKNYYIYNKNLNSFILGKDKKYGIADVTGKLLVAPALDEITYDNRRKLYMLNKDKKYGAYFETSGFETPVIYNRLSTDGMQYLTLIKDKKWGIIDYNGKVILPVVYDRANVLGFNKGFKVVKNGKQGINDNEGKIVIPPLYESIDNFNFKRTQLYIVEKDGKKGVLDKQNNTIISIEFDRLFNRNDYIIVSKNDKYGLYAEGGVLVAEPQYDWIAGSETERSKLQFSRKEGRYGIIAPNNTILYPARFTSISYLHNERMLLNPFNNGKAYRILKDEDGKTGLFEEFSATTVVPIIYDDILQKFDADNTTYFVAIKNNKYGIINGDNTIVIPFNYSYISLNHAYYTGSLNQVHVVAAKMNKYGVINLKNEIVVPFQYKALEKLSHEDLYKAKRKENYVLINANNTILTKGPFDEIAQFEQGEALTFYKGKMRVVNNKGLFITDPVAMEPHNGYKTFDSMKAALITALNSDTPSLLKEFAARAAPSAHILYFFKENMFNGRALGNTDPTYIRNRYYQDLYKFKMQEWNTGYYNKSSLTNVNDYTLYSRRYDVVTNKRTTDWAFGDTRLMEKIMRNAIKVNGYWISTYFMTRRFNR